MKAVGKGLLLVLTRKLLRLCTDKEKDELEEQAPTSWTKEKLRGMWEAFTATGRCPSPEGSRACLAFSCPATPQHANSRASELYGREHRDDVLAEAFKIRETDPGLTLTQAKKRALWKVWKGLALGVREAWLLKCDSPSARFKDASTGQWKRREIIDVDVVAMLVPPVVAAMSKCRGPGLNVGQRNYCNMSRADFSEDWGIFCQEDVHGDRSQWEQVCQQGGEPHREET